MSRSAVDDEDPDRLYTITGGRGRPGENDFDLVTLIVSERDPVPGMQSEYIKILAQCRAPTAVAELSADLRLPISVVKILLCDMLDAGHISARHPAAGTRGGRLPDLATLEQVLLGLKRL
jgi:hypothetical protein